MKEKKVRILALALALILASGMASCGDAPSQSDDSTDGSDGSTTPTPETTGEFDPGVPTDKLDCTFTFAVRGTEGDAYVWNGNDIVVDGETGDVLNDAIWDRNMYMKDVFGVEIQATFCGGTGVSTTGSEMYTKIQQSIMADDKVFDAILTSPYDSIGYAMNDLVVDLTTVENLDLSRKWWDQNANEQLAFGSKIFITTGELTFIDNRATMPLLFSKDLAEDFKLDDHYKLVKDGKWTLDKFIENCKAVSADVDGVDGPTEGDRYGYVWHQDACFSFVYSTGNSFASLNKDGKPEVTLYSERMVSTWEKLISFLSTDASYSMTANVSKFGGNIDNGILKMFENKQVLYGFSTMHNVVSYRSSDFNFGLLPYPKYDEEQENYVTTPGAYGHTMLTVPRTNDNLPRTGIILEAFSAKSMELVTPAYYEATLVGKSLRDDESEEMLDILYSTKRYDIGHFFMIGNYANSVMSAWNNKSSDFASLYEAGKKVAETDIEKISELFE